MKDRNAQLDSIDSGATLLGTAELNSHIQKFDPRSLEIVERPSFIADTLFWFAALLEKGKLVWSNIRYSEIYSFHFQMWRHNISDGRLLG